MTPSNYEDKHYALSFVITLAANQEITGAVASIDKDSDFFWESTDVQYQGNGGNPGLPFAVRFTDSSNYQLSDGLMGNFAFAAATGLGVPYTWTVPIFFPAGSAITLDFQDLSGNSNGPIQFLFKGRKRFYK